MPFSITTSRSSEHAKKWKFTKDFGIWVEAENFEIRTTTIQRFSAPVMAIGNSTDILLNITFYFKQNIQAESIRVNQTSSKK